jgi:hypothetical protein
MTKINDPEMEKITHAMMMSPTLGRLVQMAESMPPTDSLEGLKTGLATTSIEVVMALDKGQIEFKDPQAAAFLYGMLTVCIDFVMGGRLAKAGCTSRVN